ncbi:hypothetical protein TI39_contig270g00003 [Zymoseptoria brevis]|uniref:Uncharacterized protein n=1 Tax=Zymoseptoria brevis TaxID=1047168 RepID=A0A0F4GY52_9PEZI|nr:hypothetical protein TI39_contig270g00003 [Zymoseptoria brevis]
MSDTNPASTTPSPCSNICCEPFFSHQDVPITNPTSLSNPISALFAESQFQPQSDPKMAAHAPAFNYAAIEPALRLASRFLTLDSVVKLIVVMADGDLRVEDEHGVFQATTWAEVDASRAAARNPVDHYSAPSRHPKPEHKVVDDTMRRRAEDILTQAIPMMSIDLHTLSGYGGFTEAVLEPALPRSLAATYPRGRRSRVHVGADLLALIDHAGKCISASLDPTPEHPFHAPTALSFTFFRLARTLVHELFHALEMAYNGLSSHHAETFYGSAALSECGFEVENAIFGGIPLPLWICKSESVQYTFCAEAVGREQQTRFTDRIVLGPWPSETYFRYYKHNGCLMGVRPNHHGSNADVLDRIDTRWVEQLLSESFWEAGVGPGPLVLPKVGRMGWAWDESRETALYTSEGVSG